MDVVDFMDSDNIHHDGHGTAFPLNRAINPNNLSSSHHYQLNQHYQNHHHSHQSLATSSDESDEWDSYAPFDVYSSQDEVDGYISHDSADGHSHENIRGNGQPNPYPVRSPPEWEEEEPGMVQGQPTAFGFSNNSPFFGSSQTHVFNRQWIQEEDKGEEEVSDTRDPSRIYIQAVRGQIKSQRAFDPSRNQQQQAKPFVGFLMNDGRVFRKRDVTGTIKNDWEDWGERNEMEDFDKDRTTKCGRVGS